MPKRATSRRERIAHRKAAARRRRILAWTLPGLVVAAGAVTAGVLLLDRPGGDPDQAASQLALGEAVFQRRCATCHGDDLRGTFVGPPLIHELYAPDVFPDDGIRAAIANGVPSHNWDAGAMPPVSGLGRDDVEAVISYVRSMQRAGGLGAVTAPGR